MQALVTAELTEAGEARLAALGYQVQRAGWGRTGQVLTEDELAVQAAGAQLLLVEVEQVSRALLQRLPALRLVGTARGAPVNVDLVACAERGIPVLHAPARNADSVADFTLGVVLALVRGIAAGERQLRARGWLVDGQLPYLHFRGPELSGLTLGIVGLGAIGSRVAQRARDGFGMRVLHTDPVVAGGVPLADLLAESDVLSLHCPRSADTVGLLDAARLALLRPTAYVVNTAGGGIVDEPALVRALRDGRLAGAALDVFADEPLPAGSPLLDTPGLLLTPHLAGAAHDVVRHHSELLCADVERFHAGRPLVHAAV